MYMKHLLPDRLNSTLFLSESSRFLSFNILHWNIKTSVVLHQTPGHKSPTFSFLKFAMSNSSKHFPAFTLISSQRFWRVTYSCQKSQSGQPETVTVHTRWHHSYEIKIKGKLTYSTISLNHTNFTLTPTDKHSSTHIIRQFFQGHIIMMSLQIIPKISCHNTERSV
jgi:hypothetical protein